MLASSRNDLYIRYKLQHIVIAYLSESASNCCGVPRSCVLASSRNDLSIRYKLQHIVVAYLSESASNCCGVPRSCVLASSRNDLSNTPPSGTNSSTLVIGSGVAIDARLCLLCAVIYIPKIL